MYTKIAESPDIQATEIVWSQPGMDCGTGLNQFNNSFTSEDGVTATVKSRMSLVTGCSDASHTKVGFNDGERLLVSDPRQGSIRIRLDPPVQKVWTQIAVLSTRTKCDFTCTVRAIGNHGEVKDESISGSTKGNTLNANVQYVGMSCGGDKDEPIQFIEFSIDEPNANIDFFMINQLRLSMGAAETAPQAPAIAMAAGSSVPRSNPAPAPKKRNR